MGKISCITKYSLNFLTWWNYEEMHIRNCSAIVIFTLRRVQNNKRSCQSLLTDCNQILMNRKSIVKRCTISLNYQLNFILTVTMFKDESAIGNVAIQSREKGSNILLATDLFHKIKFLSYYYTIIRLKVVLDSAMVLLKNVSEFIQEKYYTTYLKNKIDESADKKWNTI